MRTRTALLAAALVTCIAAPHARAESRAWTAAKANLPADSAVVVGLNFGSIRKSALFAKLYPALISQKPELQQAFDLAKTVCKIDPIEAVDSAVIGTDVDQKGGAVYLALKDLDEGKLVGCFESVAANKGAKDAKVTIKHDGSISELSSPTSTDKVFIGWVGKDVLVVSFTFNDKASLQRWMGGKGALAKSGVGKPVSKVNTSAAGWLGLVQDKELDPGIRMKAGWGSLDIGGGNVSTDFHIQIDSAANAAKQAASMNKQLSDLLASGAVPASVQPLAKSVKIGATGDELTVKAGATEQAVMTVIQFFMSVSGGGGATP
jgi:hypothetical protein